MSVRIRKMTEEEFAFFWQWSMECHTWELIQKSHMSREAAIKEAKEALAGMLPAGLETENNHLMSVVETEKGEVVGFLWTIHEESEGRKQSFVCDFAIWERERRKGYGKAALLLAEICAAKAGCVESVLFVADDNVAARALYDQCGYQVLRPHGYGRYMKKQLAKG